MTSGLFSRPPRILLVDDNRGDAALFSRALKEVAPDALLTCASTGEAALAHLAGESEAADHALPDLILLDLGLPRMSGIDVLSAIKQNDGWKHIPVIVMSNSGAAENVLASYRHYASAYLTKPADIHQFRTTIASTVKFYFHLATLASSDA